MNNPLVHPDPGLFVWTVVTFLVLLFLLTKFAWRPLLTMLQKRQDEIRQALADAAESREEFEKLQRESKQILHQAKVEGQAILGASRTEAERRHADILQKAKAEAQALVEQTRRQIETEKEKAKADLMAELRNEVADLSVMLASKLIHKHLSPEDDWRLIEESLHKIRPSQN